MVLLLGLFAGIAYLIAPADAPPEPAHQEEPAHRARGQESTKGLWDAPAFPRAAPESEVAPAAAAPTATSPQLAAGPTSDGGTPATAAPSPEEPAEPAAESQASGEPLVIDVEPLEPETALRTARQLRNILDQRIRELRDRADAAREAGDRPRAERLSRMVERMEADRPNADRLVSDLERRVSDGEGTRPPTAQPR